MFSNTIRTTWPAATVRPEYSEHWIARPFGDEQEPTSTPAISSCTLPPDQPANVVPAGSPTSIRLLASCASAPVADAAKRTT
jgi:hypothetical protein